MGAECGYNFDDLFRAATGREMTSSERTSLDAASQDRRNQFVKRWVAETRGAFCCEDRRGSDGHTYTAFWAV